PRNGLICCTSEKGRENGRNYRARHALYNHPSDYLLRGILLSGRRIRVRFRWTARFGQRGAMGDRNFCIPAWLDWQPACPGRAVFRPDGVEHDAPGTEMTEMDGMAGRLDA